jgi:hypothetical protein
MADDGTGSSVHIPTFLIGHLDGSALKRELYKEVELKYGQKGKNKKQAQPIII